jgi:hypothetical protein
MSSTTYPKFSLRSDPRRPGSASHWPLLPILDPTSARPGKSIHVPINSLPLWMHLSYHNMFPDVSYMFPLRRFQDPSRCTKQRMWRTDYLWTSLSCSHPPISEPGDYAERSLCVPHVPRYLRYYSLNSFSIHAFNHRERVKLSRAVWWQYILNQRNPHSIPNLTHQLNPGNLFPLSCAEPDLGVNPESPPDPDHLSLAQLHVGRASAAA